MEKRKKAARIDLPTAMLLAEEDFAAMRPALAVAPDLMVQTLTRTRKRRAQKTAKKKVRKARNSSSKKASRSSRKKTRKPSPKRKSKTAKRAGRR
jgi:hypothetical protein